MSVLANGIAREFKRLNDTIKSLLTAGELLEKEFEEQELKYRERELKLITAIEHIDSITHMQHSQAMRGIYSICQDVLTDLKESKI